MLRGIPNCITPELLKVLHEMGHGDTLVIGDANFAAASIAAAQPSTEQLRAVFMFSKAVSKFPQPSITDSPFGE